MPCLFVAGRFCFLLCYFFLTGFIPFSNMHLCSDSALERVWTMQKQILTEIHPNCCIFSVLLHGGWGSFLFLPITDTWPEIVRSPARHMAGFWVASGFLIRSSEGTRRTSIHPLRGCMKRALAEGCFPRRKAPQEAPEPPAPTRGFAPCGAKAPIPPCCPRCLARPGWTWWKTSRPPHECKKTERILIKIRSDF